MITSGSWRRTSAGHGEIVADLRLDLHLVDPLQRVLDGVFRRQDLAVGGIEFLQSGVEGRGLAAAGGAGDQQDAVRLGQGLAYLLQGSALKAEGNEIQRHIAASKMRRTTLSPCRVGEVAMRKSVSRPCTVRLIRPSCGRRRSAMFRCAMILMRDTTDIFR